MSVITPGNVSMEHPGVGEAVGAPVPKTDGLAKLDGSEIFGADRAPEDALWLRVVRSPHASATFTLGSLDNVHGNWPGLVKVLTAADGLIPARGETLVFERTYTAEHLRAHEEQNVQSMRLKLKRSGFVG